MSITRTCRLSRFFSILLLVFTLSACGGGDTVVPDDFDEQDIVPPVASRILEQMVISPFVEQAPKGSEISFTSTGIYSDNESEDITSQVIWSVDDGDIASIDNNGRLSLFEPGNIIVAASYQGVNAEKTLTITAATIDSIKIIPQEIELAAGLTQEFQATGRYSDGSSLDISHLVQWGSSNTLSVQIDKGTASAQSEGAGVITAALEGIVSSADVTVTAAYLQTIEFGTADPVLEVGSNGNLNVLALYSDQSLHDVSDQVEWTIADSAIASITATGVITALSPGQTLVSAQFKGLPVETILQVNDATLTRIAITPAKAAVAAGYVQVYQATGIYSNQTARDLTQLVSWITGDSAIASIDNRPEEKGHSTGFSPGETTVSAAYLGRVASAELTVNAAELVNIQVEPAVVTRAEGLRQPFVAYAFYSDGSQQAVTDFVDWSSDKDQVAVADGSRPGVFQAIEKGSAMVIATLKGVRGFSQFTVSDAVLTDLVLSAETDQMALGASQQLSATAGYSDGSYVDVTDQVAWSTNSSGIYISNLTSSAGQIVGLEAVLGSVSANLDGVKATLDVEVSSAQLEKIEVSVVSLEMSINESYQLEATGIYTDGSQQVLTSQAHWNSSDSQIVSVAYTTGHEGRIQGVNAGSASILASFDGIESSAVDITVVDKSNLPGSIGLQARPNVILNNGIDTTTIRATLKPLQTHGVIADGTRVNFVIEEDQSSRTVSAYTSGGMATIELQSTTNGFIQISAQIVDTDLKATTTVFSTDNFVQALQIKPIANVSVTSDLLMIEQGSLFALYIWNISNRDFNLEGFQMKNGAEYLPGLPVYDPDYLSNGKLEGGEYTGAGYKFDADTVNNGLSAGYLLFDESTQEYFGFIVSYGFQ